MSDTYERPDQWYRDALAEKQRKQLLGLRIAMVFGMVVRFAYVISGFGVLWLFAKSLTH